jgi:hypothetical protein
MCFRPIRILFYQSCGAENGYDCVGGHTKGHCSSSTVSKENSVLNSFLRHFKKPFLRKKGLLFKNHRNYVGMVHPQTVRITPKFCKKRLLALKT